MKDPGHYQALKARVRRELDKPQVRRNFRQAMDGIRARRAEQFAEPGYFEALRERARAIRQKALDRLPELLDRLERQLERNGIRVHHAADAAEANALILDLLRRAGARSVIKGKSMVSEETALNEALDDAGIQVIESDLGEYIIQLAHEPPSHIVAPAIHKNRREVAELFREHHPELEYTEDIDRLTGNARQVLRERFACADAGISGVNFAVAETGTLVLVENEGNGRLSTTAPPLHIAITGIEKVVESLDEIPPLLEILTKSATGQPITTYVNFISRPRQPDELDGPREVHLVLLDNGRSRIREDEALAETLRCIRCGACINHCPVYVQVGGHAYGSVYPGPIGSVLEPQRLGLTEMGSLTSACTLCGACGDVCPVGIPLPELINRLRAEAVEPDHVTHVPDAGALRRPGEALVWQLWKTLYGHPGLYRGFTWLATRLSGLTPSRLGPWTRYRSVPRPAARTLHELARAEGIPARARKSDPAKLPAHRGVDDPIPQVQRRTCGNREECIDRFIARQQAVRGEVHRLHDGDWLDWLAKELPRRGVK
ncbi:MAG: iron-sulfur cluster-binding protein, partial [Gammaproteobacteria bacterium]